MLLVWLVMTGVAAGQGASETWRSIRDASAMNGAVESNGWTFISRAVPMVGDATEDLHAEDDLEHEIFMEMRLLASSEMDIDIDIDSASHSHRLSLFLPAVQLRGIVQVESSHEQDTIRVVYAVPTKELQADSITTSQISGFIQDHLERPLENDRSKWGSPLVFISDLSFNQSLKKQAIDRLSAGYPNGLGGLIQGNLPTDIDQMWCDLPESLSAQALTELDDWELLDVLEHRSQDRDLVLELRRRLEEVGLGSMARQLKIPDSVEWGTVGSADILKTFDLIGESRGTKLDVICRANGTMPLASSLEVDDDLRQARVAFFSDPPDFKKAVSLLVRSIDSRPTVENLNLLAACLIESDHSKLAVPVARQAWRSNPEHPYAGINYLRALHQAEATPEQLESTMASIEASANLDDWGIAQLKSIRDSIKARRERASQLKATSEMEPVSAPNAEQVSGEEAAEPVQPGPR